MQRAIGPRSTSLPQQEGQLLPGGETVPSPMQVADQQPLLELARCLGRMAARQCFAAGSHPQNAEPSEGTHD